MAVKPVSKAKGQDYANPDNAYKWNYHAGIDYPAMRGTKIVAPKAGTFKWIAGDNGGYGNIVQVITRFGFKHWISHASLREGINRKVKQGELIGRTGNTGWSSGPHAHWEVRWENKDLDPELWLWMERKFEAYEKQINTLKKQNAVLTDKNKSLETAIAEQNKLVSSLSERPTKDELDKMRVKYEESQKDLTEALKNAENAEEVGIRKFLDFLLNLFKKGQ